MHVLSMMCSKPTVSQCSATRAAVLMVGLLLLGAGAASAATPQEAPRPGPPRPPFMTAEAYDAARQAAIDIYITTPTDKPNVMRAVVGAGFVIDPSGYALTCSHVAEPEGTRTAGLHDARVYEDGLRFRVVARNDAMDLAIIKIETAGRTLTPAKIGRSGALKVGDPVLAIGNPDGHRHSVASGKLTALAANWGYPWGSGGTWHHDFLACNAPAKSGYSGGPLFNAQGEVIGLFAGSMTGGTEPASFAVPIDKIIARLPEVLDVENAQGMIVGLKVAPLGVAEVTALEAGSPAASSGLRRGDVIAEFSGRRVTVGLDYYLGLLDQKPGDQLRLRYRRDGVEAEARLTIGHPPQRRAETVAGLLPGLNVAYYEGQWNQLPDFAKLTPARTGVARSLDVSFRKRDDHFALKFSGYVKIPRAGRYQFSSASDDGSRLYIGDQLVVDSDGLHGPTAVKGYISLEAGIHSLSVVYFEAIGGETLTVEYEGPGVARQKIPAAALFYAPEPKPAAAEAPAAAAPSSGAAVDAPKPDEKDNQLPGHSSHGESFNEGPRQRAYLMEGMGKVHFPVSTKHQLAQKFVDQGVAQLHGFWYFEAERSFRQAAAIDPKCAMAYWGMAMANVKNETRAKGFMAQAVKCKTGVTPRETKYIDALDAFLRAGTDKKKERAEAYVKALESIVCDHPDDIEAKAFLVLQLWVNRDVGVPIASNVAVDALLQQVLKVEPMHPCHHYRIHLWDEDRRAQALDSAVRCGQSSPGIAHMWHMPGHIYSGMKRYADAAWYQEAATRVDHAHMIRDGVLPDEIHNYAHNNEWLIRNLSHVGRVRDAVDMAKSMIDLPRHPRFNSSTARGSASLGRQRLFEVLDRYELWDELIKLCGTPYLEPTDAPAEQIKRLRYLGTAHIRRGDVENGTAQLTQLKRRLAEQQAGKPKAVAEAEAKAQEKLKAQQAEKKGPVDPKAVETAKVDAAKPFDEQIGQLEKAVDSLEGHLAVHRKQYDEGLKRLTKAGDIDGMVLAQLKGLAASADKLTIQQVKSVGAAFVAGAESHVQVVVENTNEAPLENIEIELTAGEENVVRQSVAKLEGKKSHTVDFKFRFKPGGKVQLGAKVVRADVTPEAAAREFVASHEGEAQPLAKLVSMLWNAGKKEAATGPFQQLREVASAADLDSPVFARLQPVAEHLKLPKDWRLPPAAETAAAETAAVPRPTLESLGPLRWIPVPAASWKLADATGKLHGLADYRGRPVVVIFYLGHGCLHCVKQLQAFAPKTKDFAAAGISLIAISSEDDAALKQSTTTFQNGAFPFPLVSNAALDTFKSYRAFDDFENRPLHGTFLIDPAGRIRWQDIRFEPFMDVDFLLGEAKRLLAQ